MAIDLEGLFKLFETEFEGGKTEQKGREASGFQALKNVLKMFGPGFEAGARKRAMSDADAALSGRGLGNTTLPAGISAGLRLESEDRRRAGMSGALSNLANAFLNYRDPFSVTPGVLSHTATGGFGNLLNRDLAVESANQAVSDRSAANLANARATNPYMNFHSGGGGGSVNPFGSGDLINLRSSVGGGGGGVSPADLGTGTTAGFAPGSSRVAPTGTASSTAGGGKISGMTGGVFADMNAVRQRYPGAVETGKSASGQTIWEVGR